MILFYACVTFKILEKIISGYKNLISKRIPDSKYLAFNLKICTNMVFCHYQQLIVLLFWSAIVFDLMILYLQLHRSHFVLNHTSFCIIAINYLGNLHDHYLLYLMKQCDKTSSFWVPDVILLFCGISVYHCLFIMADYHNQ